MNITLTNLLFLSLLLELFSLIPGSKMALSIACGQTSSMALLDNGEVVYSILIYFHQYISLFFSGGRFQTFYYFLKIARSTLSQNFMDMVKMMVVLNLTMYCGIIIVGANNCGLSKSCWFIGA